MWGKDKALTILSWNDLSPMFFSSPLPACSWCCCVLLTSFYQQTKMGCVTLLLSNTFSQRHPAAVHWGWLGFQTAISLMMENFVFVCELTQTDWNKKKWLINNFYWGLVFANLQPIFLVGNYDTENKCFYGNKMYSSKPARIELIRQNQKVSGNI